MSENRLDYIDTVKGLAIFLMVLGHSYSGNNAEYVVRWIYSFHMPLFFITTGGLYALRHNIKPRFAVKKKMKTLIRPYLIWGTLYQIFIATLNIIGGAPIINTLFNRLQLVIRINGSSMWFLPTMFGAYMLFVLIYRITKDNIYIHFIGALVIIVGSIFIANFNNNELLSIGLKMIIGTGFISIGYCMNIICNRSISLTTLIIFTVIDFVLASINNTVSLLELCFGNPIMYVWLSCLGTLVIYEWCKKIKPNTKWGYILQFWGRHSLEILCLHGFVVQIVRLMDYKILGNLLPSLGYGEGIVFVIIIMTVLSIVLMKKNSIMNWSFGK